MASFSDDEQFEIDSILEQRKRKGIQQYLVQWRGAEASWEPAEKIAADCAAAVETFVKSLKNKSRRSTSKTRKSSRSRSRSQSRGRKGTFKAVRRSSRSRSRGRKAETPPKKEVEAKETFVKARRSLEVKESSKVEAETNTSELKVNTPEQKLLPTASSSSLLTSSTESNSTEKTQQTESHSGRILRSSTMETRQKLEVQRVHNEQRPVREDDDKPRSPIWKIADYAVIALFIVSLVAAIFMFLEKFIDLEDFKKQAFPSFDTLGIRLQTAKNHLVEFLAHGWDQTTDAWDYILTSVKQPETQASAPPPK